MRRTLWLCSLAACWPGDVETDTDSGTDGAVDASDEVALFVEVHRRDYGTSSEADATVFRSEPIRFDYPAAFRLEPGTCGVLGAPLQDVPVLPDGPDEITLIRRATGGGETEAVLSADERGWFISAALPGSFAASTEATFVVDAEDGGEAWDGFTAEVPVRVPESATWSPNPNDNPSVPASELTITWEADDGADGAILLLSIKEDDGDASVGGIACETADTGSFTIPAEQWGDALDPANYLEVRFYRYIQSPPTTFPGSDADVLGVGVTEAYGFIDLVE